MYRGIANITLDERGRIAIPKMHREQLLERSGGKVVVTISHLDLCLNVFAERDFDDVAEKLTSGDDNGVEMRRHKRMVIGYATDVELDGNARLVIPARLRNYAQIGKKAVVVGQDGNLEVWSKQAWDESEDVWIADASARIGK